MENASTTHILDSVNTMIGAHPEALTHVHYAFDNLGTLIRSIAAVHPAPAEITASQIDRLYEQLLLDHPNTNGIEFGGIRVHTTRGLFRFYPIWRQCAKEQHEAPKSLCFSPYIAGVHEKLPRDEQAVERFFLATLRKYFDQYEYDGPAIGAHSIVSSSEGKSALQFAAPYSEDRTEVIDLDIEHKCAQDIAAIASKAARYIALQWRHRDVIGRHIADQREYIKSSFAHESDISLEDIYPTSMTFSGDQCKYVVMMAIRMLGPTLAPYRRNFSLPGGKDGEEQVAKILREHRRRAKRLADRSPEEARTIAPIVANAVLAAPAEFAQQILIEIESVCAGKAMTPKNPRKRRIANFSMHEGRLDAPVTLGKNVRFTAERLLLKKMTLPETLIKGINGIPLRRIVDHPFLEGLSARSATVSSQGAHIRPETAAIPLQPVIDALRERAAAYQPKAKGRRKSA